jgi:hypothetical protein
MNHTEFPSCGCSLPLSSQGPGEAGRSSLQVLFLSGCSTRHWSALAHSSLHTQSPSSIWIDFVKPAGFVVQIITPFVVNNIVELSKKDKDTVGVWWARTGEPPWAYCKLCRTPGCRCSAHQLNASDRTWQKPFQNCRHDMSEKYKTLNLSLYGALPKFTDRCASSCICVGRIHCVHEKRCNFLVHELGLWSAIPKSWVQESRRREQHPFQPNLELSRLTKFPPTIDHVGGKLFVSCVHSSICYY